MSEYYGPSNFWGLTSEQIEEIKTNVAYVVENHLRLDSVYTGEGRIQEMAAFLYLRLLNPNATWNFGAKPAPPDKPIDVPEVDHHAMAPGVPPVVNMSGACSPVEDQANMNSCVGNAIVGGIELFENRARSMIDRSRLFIYWNARYLENDVDHDDGCYISDAMKVIATMGVCQESIWPYQRSLVFTRPSDEAYRDAANFKITQYLKVSDRNVDAARKVLASGYPVIVGMDCFDYFFGSDVMRTGMLRMPISGDKKQGGHGILLVGYDDNKRAFLVRNSWGPFWGLNGYFYMPYDYYASYSWDAYTITQI